MVLVPLMKHIKVKHQEVTWVYAYLLNHMKTVKCNNKANICSPKTSL